MEARAAAAEDDPPARLKAIEARRQDGPKRPIMKAYDTEEVWRGRGWYARKLEIVLAGLLQRHLASTSDA